MKIFNHVQIKVTNLDTSRRFYDAIMHTLGYGIVLEIKDTVVGYGTSTHDMFEIRQHTEQHPLSLHIHIAFNAMSMTQVDQCYRIALEHGGRCNGKPGYRPEYEAGYYAAFVIDPDGNNIEAVHTPFNTLNL